jgi:hypothetical protein
MSPKVCECVNLMQQRTLSMPAPLNMHEVGKSGGGGRAAAFPHFSASLSLYQMNVFSYSKHKNVKNEHICNTACRYIQFENI